MKTTTHTPTPQFTPCTLKELTNLEVANDRQYMQHIVHCVNTHAALVAALEGLYAHCSMIHKWWGEDDNNRQASAAIAAGRAALALAAGKE